MIKRKHSLVALTAATLAVSACVQQIWKATYPGPNDYYSESYDVAVDSEQNAILLGRTQDEDSNDTLFVAKYNAAGNLVWAYEAPGYFNTHFPKKDHLSVNNDNHILLAGITLEPEQQTKVTLLNEQGEKLWDKSFGFPVLYRLATTFDNQYLVITSSDGLQSFSQNGDLLWQFSTGGSAGDPYVDLPGFGNEINTNASTASYNNGVPNIELAVNANNEIFVAGNGQIFKLDSLGNQIHSLLYSELTDEKIADLAVSDDRIAILGTSATQSTVYILDTNLELINSHIIDLAYPNAVALDIADNGLVCFALTHTISNTSKLISGSMSDDGMIWQSEDTGDFFYRDLVTVQATDSTCQVSTNESIEEPFVTGYTRIYNPTGELKDTLSIKDYAGHDSLATGNMIYSTGITGNYDGSVGTRATLFKHKQK